MTEFAPRERGGKNPMSPASGAALVEAMSQLTGSGAAACVLPLRDITSSLGRLVTDRSMKNMRVGAKAD
jgi:hypothetical protein